MNYLWKSSGKQGWRDLRDFIRMKRSVGEVVKRSELLEEINGLRQWTVDSYTRYLRKAGYLRSVVPGCYRIEKEIPESLTMNQCRLEAYNTDSNGLNALERHHRGY